MSQHRSRLASIAIAAVAALPAVLPDGAQAAARGCSGRLCHAQVGPFECAVARCRSTTTGRAVRRSRSRYPRCRRPTRSAGSARCSSTPAGRAVPASTYVLCAGPLLYTDEVRARFDLVGFDPRGHHPQHALRCFGSDAQWPPFPPFAFPLTREEEQAWIAVDRALDRACASAAARSATTCRRPTWRATWTCCASGRRRASSPTPASPTAPTSASPTPTCSRTGARARRRRRAGPDRVVDRPRRCEGNAGPVLDAAAQRRRRAGDTAGVLPAVRRRRPACAFSGGAAARFAALAARLRTQPVEATSRTASADGRLLDPDRHHARRRMYDARELGRLRAVPGRSRVAGRRRVARGRRRRLRARRCRRVPRAAGASPAAASRRST